MRAGLAELDMLRGFAERLRNAGHGEKDGIVAEATHWLGCSAPTFYRRLREIGAAKERKLRSDKGDSKISYDELLTLSTLWSGAGCRRVNGKWLGSVDDAIDMALSNGWLTTRISGATALRLFTQYDLHRKQVGAPRPHTQLQSLHPNHVWQVDPSICIVYYSQRDGVRVLDERQFYKNKPDYVAKMTPLRVWRYVQTDHYSGSIYARYFEALGENQAVLFQFLMSAMLPTNAAHIMRGVPYCLIWDKGSANTSHGIQELLTALQVRHWAHTQGNSRAKGQVENGNNIVETRFESRLAFTRVPTVEQLNERLDDWLIAQNACAIHSRHGHTRYGLWQTVQASQLRNRPDEQICRELLTSKPEPRTVRGDLTVQWQGRTYGVDHVPDIRVGEVLQVVVNAYRAPAICIVREDAEGKTRFHVCEPQETNAAGFSVLAPIIGEAYAAKPDTGADKARKAQNQLAYGTADSGEVEKLRAKGVPAHEGRFDVWKDIAAKAAAAPQHIARRGTDLHVPNPVQVELKPLSLVEALRALREWLGRPISSPERELVAEWYPQGVPETDLGEIVNRLSQPAQEERPRLALVR